ncbi:hypothetical protein P43SY_009019 [Pythium insidiosum]|uniref:Alcohol dehydrogenase n=1 Tax=Pythium insidiosum TaxID=114742 RepID=A0AAD5M3Z1_PYTIN|nr:hypothetical protein P43SY_009019 [Pythium insidiosum]
MEFIKKFSRTKSAPVSSAAPPGEMKAVVFHGGKSVSVDHVPCPKLQQGTDLIVQVTACSVGPGFCSQVCAGEVPGMEKGQVLGREAVGVVTQIGSDVAQFKEGDRVVLSMVIACGDCSYCRRGEFSACNRTNESREFARLYGGWAPAAVFGSSRLLGNVPGSLAEYVRVPFGDVNCLKIPNGVTDDQALMVGDTAVAGLHAAELAEIKGGESVVIWGLGPVGVIAAKWAKMKGAKRVIGVDLVHERLKTAYDRFGLEVLDRTGLSSAELTKKLLDTLPDGGADVAIDACGAAASPGWMKSMEKAVGMDKESTDILKECATVTRKCGRVVVIADVSGHADNFPIGYIMTKHLTLRAGQVPVQRYWKKVMQVIEGGELDPTELISHRATSLDDAPELIEHACKKDGEFFKAVIHPHHGLSL